MQNAKLQLKIQNFKKIKKELPGVQKNVLLKNYTTFKIGGPAKYFFVARTKKDLFCAITAAKKLKLPFFVLGGGSNLLVSDKGYNGLVINFQFSIFNFRKNKIIVGAGTRLGELVNVSAERGLIGLEWAAGIPGTIGGAVFGNAGAFQKSMKDVIEKVEVLDVKDLRFKIYNFKKCKFSYRDSIFKHKKNLIILSVVFKLKKAKKSEIKKKIKEYLNYRKESQPLNYPSAGSIFKNYELRLQPARGRELPLRGKLSRPDHPSALADPIMNYELIKKFPELKEFNKKRQIPAAWLIEKCGLKGRRIGGAQISKKHANFIFNLENARAEDVKKLIDLIKKEAKKKFGASLDEEIQYLEFKS